MTPNKENIQLWIDALRSGRYRQDRFALFPGITAPGEPVQACCLGVACLTHAEATGSEQVYDYEYLGEEKELPEEVLEWLGLDPRQSDPAVITTDGHHEHLTVLNDTRRLSFEEIADLIEAEFLNEEEAA